MTTNNTWPNGAPRDAPYMAFRMVGDSVYTILGDEPITEDEAAARFQRKHGQPPEFVCAVKGYLRLGPEPGRGEDG